MFLSLNTCQQVCGDVAGHPVHAGRHEMRQEGGQAALPPPTRGVLPGGETPLTRPLLLTRSRGERGNLQDARRGGVEAEPRFEEELQVRQQIEDLFQVRGFLLAGGRLRVRTVQVAGIERRENCGIDKELDCQEGLNFVAKFVGFSGKKS